MSNVAHPLAPELRALNGRDLAALIVSLLLVVAPHAQRAPWWLSVVVLFLYAWRAYLGFVRAPLPPRWLLLALTAAGIAGIWIHFHTVFGRTPGIVVLCFFSGLKLLEMRNHRDAGVVAFLCFFLIITNFFYTQSIPTALLMCVALAAITTTLVGFAAPQRPSRANLRTAGLFLAHAIPVALVLFLLFPRVQGPLWGVPQDAYAGITGLSDTMSPGNLAHLAHSDAVAFRVEFNGKPPPSSPTLLARPRAVGFRRPHLAHGHRRSSPSSSRRKAASRPIAIASFSSRTTTVGCTHWKRAASLPSRSSYTADGEILARRPIRQSIRYDLESVIDPAPDPTEDPAALQRALRLPAGFDLRSVALAHQWRDASHSDTEIRPPRPRFPAPRPLRLHARSTAAGHRYGRRIPVRDQGRLLRVLRLRVRVPDARRRHPGARRDRLPGRRHQPSRSHRHGAPVGRACLGRGLPAAGAAGRESIQRPLPMPGRIAAGRWSARCPRANFCRC